MYKKAKKNINIALNMFEEIKDDNPEALLDLLLSYRAVASMYMRSNLSESERLYLRAIELVSIHKFDSKYITYFKGILEKSLGGIIA